MKKIIALLLTLTAVFASSFSTFAATTNSPVAPTLVSVTIRSAVGKEGVTSTDTPVSIAIDGQVKLAPDSSKGTFKTWSVYKRDGTKAAAGTDYDIISGSLNTAELTLKIKSDVIICGNYGNTVTDPITGEAKKPVSPETGDTVLPLAMVMVMGLAIFVGAKKQLCR